MLATMERPDKTAVLARIDGLMETRGFRSDRELSLKATGKHFTMRNLRQSAKLNVEALGALAQTLGTTTQYLFFGGHGGEAESAPSPAGRAVLFDACATEPADWDAPTGLERRPSWPPMNTIPIIGKVTGGFWQDIETHVDVSAYDDIPIPADPRYPPDAQFAVVVDGTSVDRTAPDGSVIACVDIRKLRMQPRQRELVVVEQVRKGGAEIQRTAKRFHDLGDRYELRPDSTDPQWTKALVIPRGEDGEEGDAIEVIGIALHVHASVEVIDRNRARHRERGAVA